MIDKSGVEAFKKRIETEKEFCEELFKETTIKLLAAKYAYYVLDKPYLEDIAYDGTEKCWQTMGIALGYLTEDDITPCIGFDEKHPLAKEAIKLANRLKK